MLEVKPGSNKILPFSCPTCHNDFYLKATLDDGIGRLHLACPDCSFKTSFAFPVTKDVSRQDLFLAAVVLMLNSQNLLDGKMGIEDALSLKPYSRVVKAIPWPFH